MRKRSEIGKAPSPSPAPTPEPEELPTSRAIREARLPTEALAKYIDFGPGDQLTITIGEEKYSPVKYRNFSVGPFSATIVVRPGETGSEAAMRCYRILLELNEAEFQVAWARHRERLTVTGGDR